MKYYSDFYHRTSIHKYRSSIVNKIYLKWQSKPKMEKGLLFEGVIIFSNVPGTYTFLHQV